MSVATVLLSAQTAILAVSSLLLLYPVLRYAWNVAYTTELLLLSGAFIALAASYVASFGFGAQTVSNALDLLAATATFVAMWRLAAGLAGRERGGLTIQTSTEVEGGFGGER